MSRGYWSRQMRAAGWIWLCGLLFVAAAVLCFRWLAGEVLERESFSWDEPILRAVHNMHTPWLDSAMSAISYVGLPGGTVVTLLVCLWLWYRSRRAAAVALAISFAGAWIIFSSLKLVFTRPRPDLFPLLNMPTDYSFPSGHALTAISLYGFIALLLWQHKQRLWALLSLLFALLICFSRIYLGVHFPSDILGALAVGILWLAVVYIGYRYATGGQQAVPLTSTPQEDNTPH